MPNIAVSGKAAADPCLLREISLEAFDRYAVLKELGGNGLEHLVEVFRRQIAKRATYQIGIDQLRQFLTFLGRHVFLPHLQGHRVNGRHLPCCQLSPEPLQGRIAILLAL